MPFILLLCGLGLAAAAIVIGAIVALITHVIVCIQTGAWILLFLGAICFPIGVVHGAGVWFGVF